MIHTNRKRGEDKDKLIKASFQPGMQPECIPHRSLSPSPISAASGPTVYYVVELCFHIAIQHGLGPEDELTLSIHTQHLAVATWAPTTLQGRLLSAELRLAHWLLTAVLI